MPAPGVTILMAMDGSKYCDYVFQWYMENIHREANNVILLHCVELPPIASIPVGIGSADVIVRMVEEEQERLERYLKALTDKLKAASLHGKVKQVHGAPRTEIIRVAEEENATMIITGTRVTGTRGMGTIKRTLMGSVSDHVLHHSHVPVLICKHKDHHHHYEHHT